MPGIKYSSNPHIIFRLFSIVKYTPFSSWLARTSPKPDVSFCMVYHAPSNIVFFRLSNMPRMWIYCEFYYTLINVFRNTCSCLHWKIVYSKRSQLMLYIFGLKAKDCALTLKKELDWVRIHLNGICILWIEHDDVKWATTNRRDTINFMFTQCSVEKWHGNVQTKCSNFSSINCIPLLALKCS